MLRYVSFALYFWTYFTFWTDSPVLIINKCRIGRKNALRTVKWDPVLLPVDYHCCVERHRWLICERSSFLIRSYSLTKLFSREKLRERIRTSYNIYLCIDWYNWHYLIWPYFFQNVPQPEKILQFFRHCLIHVHEDNYKTWK